MKQPTSSAGSVRIRILFVVLALLVGGLGGLGTFTFVYGDGLSYLSKDPAACANCHVMQEHYDTWQNSSHRHVATCNDCHMPHNFVGKWLAKADNGLFHSLAFTTNNYPQPLQIKTRNARITQNACLDCHADTVHQMLPVDAGGEVPSCVHCHPRAGHAFRARRGGAVNR